MVIGSRVPAAAVTIAPLMAMSDSSTVSGNQPNDCVGC